MYQILCVVMGFAAGLVSGFFGIGGGVIMIPLFVFFFGLTQHQAQGTTLAILALPVTLLAALRYYYAGNVKLDLVALACMGFLGGGLLGAHLVQGVPSLLLKRLFGCALLFISAKMILAR